MAALNYVHKATKHVTGQCKRDSLLLHAILFQWSYKGPLNVKGATCSTRVSIGHSQNKTEKKECPSL